jgi:hypothetical protein
LRRGLDREPFIHVLPQADLDRYLSAREKLILTDQYAPVDNLMSGVFRERTRGQ